MKNFGILYQILEKVKKKFLVDVMIKYSEFPLDPQNDADDNFDSAWIMNPNRFF